MGYKLLFVYENNILDKQAETSFNANEYDEAATVTIKVPLSLPYLADQSKFERTDGKITVNGKVYRYIKRKIVNNEMILVCLADNKAMQLNKSQNDFFKTTAGVGDNNTSKKTGSGSSDFFKSLPLYNRGNTVSYNFSACKILKANNIMLPGTKPLSLSKKPLVQPPDVA